MITEIHTEEAFQKEIATRQGLSLIDFWAPWCGPCLKVDVDELPDIAAAFDIMSIPTIVILENGEEITRLTGAMSAEEFISQLKSIAG